MLSHRLHCHDYRDNVYIFMYTFYLYALCVSRPDTPNTVPFSVYAPLARLTVRLVSLIRIRITYTFNVAGPLACPFNPPILIRLTYTYYLYVILIRITYTLYLHIILIFFTYNLNVEFSSFFSNFLENFFYSSNFSQNILPLFFSPKYFNTKFSQNIYIAPTPKISTKKIE